MLDKQDCLQLSGFLPEQSKAKVQIIWIEKTKLKNIFVFVSSK